MTGIYNVGELIRELEKLDKGKNILIGDSDIYGRNDMNIQSIIRKRQGYDEENTYYYVLSFGEHRNGAIKY